MKVWCSSVWYLALPRGDSLPKRSFVEILLLDEWIMEKSHAQASGKINDHVLAFDAKMVYWSHFLDLF